MKNKLLKLLLISAIGLFQSACSDPEPSLEQSTSVSVEVVDFTGRTVQLSKPAEKIVALAPHLVENVFSAGAGGQLIGVMEYSNFPPAAMDIAIVGGYEKTNYEKILELDPDLIIAWQTGNSHASIQRLIELGYTVYIDQADSLFDVAKSIRDIGTLSGHSAASELVADNYVKQLQQVQEKYQSVKKITSFYQVWNSPLQTISGDHIISNAIEICGGTNIYADEFAIAPIINIESVLERDPTAIIASGMSSGRPEWLDDWRQWESMTAVMQNNLFFVNPDHIQRHTVRLLLGIESVCKHLETARAK